MATPSEKLAESLQVLKKLQDEGVIAIQAKNLSRTHRERLIRNGFLQEIMKGWFIPSRQEEPIGESTAWYASFWHFCGEYLNKRFGKQWCLSPEQSLSLHVGDWTVPQQLLIRSPKSRNKITRLPHNTSLFDAQYPMPKPNEVKIIDGIRVYSIPTALIRCSGKFFTQNPIIIKAALSLIKDPSEILRILLAEGHSTIAGRLAGAFRNIGQEHIANEIIKTMSTVGYDVRENDPFDSVTSINLTSRHPPYVCRLQMLWEKMREITLIHMPKASTPPKNTQAYIKQIAATYVTDAYHSLSIEGYRVNPELIERVKAGKWDPKNENDREHVAALAARGYWQAFKEVEKSIIKVLKGKNPGEIFAKDHRDWYREMFAPSVRVGILKPHDLAGYRNAPVYIRHSMYTPPSADAVRDLMPAFCDLLSKEPEPSARIVLSHFFFVYIHPYMDGNGRMGRFLMNLMTAAAGFPWIIIPVEKRKQYLSALEEASVRQNFMPFVKFLGSLIKDKQPK